MLARAGPIVVGLIVDAGSVEYPQFAEVAPDLVGRVGKVELDPHLHQLARLYRGSPSAMHLGVEVVDEVTVARVATIVGPVLIIRPVALAGNVELDGPPG